MLALIHGWFAIPPEDIQRTVATFAIAFASFFLFLALASLRLPIIYFLIFILVVAALCFVAAAYLMTPSTRTCSRSPATSSSCSRASACGCRGP